MKVAVDAPKGIFQKRKVSAEELHTFCLDLGMTATAEKKMGAKFNELFGAMETGYQEKVREMSRLVSDKCHVTELEFRKSESDPTLVKLPLWAVNDLNEFISFIHESRNIDISETTIVLGVDMGQKFLKFTLQVINNKELEEVEGASNVKYKSTGVNKIYYFALGDSRMSENNYNVGVVF